MLKALRTIVFRGLDNPKDEARVDLLYDLLGVKSTDVAADDLLSKPGTYDPTAALDEMSLPIGKSESAEKFKVQFEDLKGAVSTLAKTGEPYARTAALFVVDDAQKKLATAAIDKFLVRAKEVEKGVADIVLLFVNVNKEKDGEGSASGSEGDTPPED